MQGQGVMYGVYLTNLRGLLIKNTLDFSCNWMCEVVVYNSTTPGRRGEKKANFIEDADGFPAVYSRYCIHLQ